MLFGSSPFSSLPVVQHDAAGVVADALDQGLAVFGVNHVIQVGIQRLTATGHGDGAVLRLASAKARFFSSGASSAAATASVRISSLP